ncbi:hypothetical protein [Campylobacter vicugnae]|nr:hypothetical protein [Campylobacter sp. S0112]
MKEIDFSNCQRNARTYNGANGSKIGIYYIILYLNNYKALKIYNMKN